VEKQEILLGIWRYLRFVLLTTLAILIATALSFLIWGPFTFPKYSERLFWAGIGAVIVGGMAIWAALGSYSTLGTPSILTAPGDAPIATWRIGEQLRMNARRYGFSFRMAAVGILCIALSALIEVLTR
jgi:hypothetical protein